MTITPEERDLAAKAYGALFIKDFNPTQPRDGNGRWTTGGGGFSFHAENPASRGESVKHNPSELRDPDDYGAVPYSAAHINPDGSLTPERQALHDKIVDEHLKGIKPSGKQPTQYMNGGGPGSGKSSLKKGANGKLTGYPSAREANEMTGELPLGEKANAVLIDPDAVKMMLPEVRAARANGTEPDWAGRSHEESSYLSKRIHQAAVDRGLDVIYDGTGDGGVGSVIKKVNVAKSKGYKVEANYLYLSPAEGQRRATSRGERTGRVLNPEMISNTYADVPKTFSAAASAGVFDTIRLFDNNNPGPDGAAKLIASGGGGTLTIADNDAYNRFLNGD